MGKEVQKQVVEELTKKEVEAKIALKTEEVKQHAAELSVKMGCKIVPVTFITDAQASDFVVGYVKEPRRLDKMRAIDKINQGQPSFAYQELLESCLIKEESDIRILSEKQEHDRYNLGAAQFCGNLLMLATDVTELKKN